MIERLRLLPLLLWATTMFLVSIAVTVAGEDAHALGCQKNCPPPPEEVVEEPDPEPLPTPGPRKHRVLVVNVGWGNGGSDNDAPLREFTLGEYVNFINGHVNDVFAESAPPGVFPGWEAVPGGSYTIRQPDLPSSCTPDERHAFKASLLFAAQEKLERAGIDTGRYNLVAVVFNRTFCWSGVYDGYRLILSKPKAVVHELGHYLDLEHAEALHCMDASNVVPLSTTCETEEYGDPFDEMGDRGNLSYNAVYANELGWLEDQYFDVRAPQTGTYTIRPFIGLGFANRAIRVKDGPTTLWIEYRRPLGMDGLATSPLRTLAYGSGVFIRREVHTDKGTVSQLLDMTPATGMYMPSLEEGQPWSNPLGEATITLKDFRETTATIAIGNRRTATVPSVIGLDPDRAAAVIAGAGLWSSGWSAVLDRTCNLVGVVASQQPLPGTKVFPDSEVRFGVGEQDPAIYCD